MNKSEPLISPPSMAMLALLIGVISGVGAVIFRDMISFIHNLLFLGQFSLSFDANAHTAPHPWGAFVILVPVIGAIPVAWLIKNFAPEAKGHGVPEVIDAIYYKKGKIRPVVAVVKSIASAISIGSGGSVGREGPIVQIGAAFGSVVGQFVKMPARQRIILVAAGAGAGIAATFNAPLGGLAFAMELMLISISAASVSIVLIATITATYIGQLFLGTSPAFNIPSFTIPGFGVINPYALMLFIPFGILIGLVSSVFIRAIYWAEDWFESLPGNYYTRHISGMFVLGLVLYAFMHFTGHYYVGGVGYATIADILYDALLNPWFLLLLCAAKLFATCLTLGSGASGGIFSPSLYLGATLGAAFGLVANSLFPGIGISPIVFAVAGMAAMVSANTGVVLTSIGMTFEMTRNYDAILPVMLTIAFAYGVRKIITRESIYTLKLLRRGHIIHEGLQAAVHSAQRAQDVMKVNFKLVASSSTLNEELINRAKLDPNCTLLVEKGGTIEGLVHNDSLVYACVDESRRLDDLAKRKYIMAAPDAELPGLLRKMQRENIDSVIITSNPNIPLAHEVLGIITPKEISIAVADTAELMI